MPWLITFAIKIDETAGVSGNVDFVNVTLSRPDGSADAINYTADFIFKNAGTNHVFANSSLAIPNFGVAYATVDGRRDLTMTVSIQFTDDRRNVFNKVVVVPVV